MDQENKEYIGRYVALLEDKIERYKKEIEELKATIEKLSNTGSDRQNPYVCRCLPNTSCMNTYCPKRTTKTSDDFNTTETGY